MFRPVGPGKSGSECWGNQGSESVASGESSVEKVGLSWGWDGGETVVCTWAQSERPGLVPWGINSLRLRQASYPL